jgi:hypothetical protein
MERAMRFENRGFPCISYVSGNAMKSDTKRTPRTLSFAVPPAGACVEISDSYNDDGKKNGDSEMLETRPVFEQKRKNQSGGNAQKDG